MTRAGFLTTAAALAALVASPLRAEDEIQVDITANIIPSFHIAHQDETHFGMLTWNGGIELESGNRALGGLSGLVVDPGGAGLLAVADDGHLFRATILRDSAGHPTGMTSGRIRPVESLSKNDRRYHWESDTESVDVWPSQQGEQVAISFEGDPRVIVGRIGADGFAEGFEDRQLPKSMAKVRNTKGLESLAVLPGSIGPDARILVIAERPEHGATVPDRPAWILGANPQRFRVKAVGDFDITDAKFGPGGDLFILERLYSLAEGVKMRIRRIGAADLVDGATVDGKVVVEANLAYQIDNMEGLAFWTDSAGRTMISLLSDDNRSFLQRTLYLEFALDP